MVRSSWTIAQDTLRRRPVFVVVLIFHAHSKHERKANSASLHIRHLHAILSSTALCAPQAWEDATTSAVLTASPPPRRVMLGLVRSTITGRMARHIASTSLETR